MGGPSGPRGKHYFGDARNARDPTDGDAYRERSALRAPEYRLVCAIIEDAIESVQKHGQTAEDRRRPFVRQAIEWLENDDVSWPFSFVNLCAIIGLSPDGIRRAVL